MSEKQIPVAADAPIGDGPEVVLSYPYARPEGSYFTDGSTVTTLSDDPAQFRHEASALLAAHELPPLEDRIPVIAYGSNASPAEFKEKMAKYPGFADDPAVQVAPMLAATIPDAEVVWHGKLGMKGSVFSDLYTGDEAKGATSNVFVEYLTEAQLMVLHVSEGTNYTFLPHDVILADGSTMQAYLYMPHQTSYLARDGHPIPVAGIGNETDELRSMNAHQAMEYILQTVGETAQAATPEEFVQNNKTLPLKPRQQRRRDVTEKLAELGVSIAHDNELPFMYGRADYNNLQHVGEPQGLIEMPEQKFAHLRPSKQALEQEAASYREEQRLKGKEITEEEAMWRAMVRLDPLMKIRNRSLEEIAARNGVDVPKRQWEENDGSAAVAPFNIKR